MALQSLRLQNFRSYRDGLFEFSEGVNIVVGPNASGKTNLLEAIQVSAIGQSYRVTDIDLVRFGSKWSRLDAAVDDSTRTIKIEVIDQKPQKTFELDGLKRKRLSHEIIEPAVLFEPEHLRLLVGGPERRREYLDILLAQTTPGYSTVLKNYMRTLAQRNRLLKQGLDRSSSQLFAWNIRLSELGGHIAAARASLTHQINQQLQTLYRELSKQPKSHASIKYESQFALEHYSNSLLHKLESSTELDFLRGFTVYGPHRDDFVVTLNNHEASVSASRGETRTALLALKIVELQLVESLSGKKPILLLDDVFSELDGARRRALTEFLRGYQTFVTTTDADVVVQHFMKTAHIIPTNKVG